MPFYRLPPIDLIHGPQASHQLKFLALLHRSILLIKTVHPLKWNRNKTASNSCEPFCISFISFQCADSL